MKFTRKFSNLSQSLFVRWKAILQRLRRRSNEKHVLFIVGCQRSGTTLLSRIFERDLLTKTFHEAGSVTQQDSRSRLRLKRLSAVDAEISRARAPLVVLKPLVESQNTKTLLDYFSGSRAIWIFRKFEDVAASNLRKFGAPNSIKDLRIIAEDPKNNWRTENISADVRELVGLHYFADMDAPTAAVLFWIARNRLYFDLDLQNDRRIYLCKYEALTTDPVRTMKDIYFFLGRRYPARDITVGTHSDSISKGSGLRVAPEVACVASDLQARLDAVWADRFDRGQFQSERSD